MEKTTADDGDVSPMEAQNAGPLHKGPVEKPLRQEKPGVSSTERESPDSPIKPGGEASTRDDL
ncbi:hypothetical protein ASG43_15415 [Aureimonas sp. Leaf454]|uniref:hypothetical protein n=1 Tax=Aureimonas sp. Leaf454 TaxID=1736381 RepID=UPI0006FE7AA4|nr:hypothetical protein [Aureimonas sp. Leaf454]KQT42940.1 hypothetical protein ASG43_15415 [Aureimonas sp. Leaf454]